MMIDVIVVDGGPTGVMSCSVSCQRGSALRSAEGAAFVARASRGSRFP